MEKILNNKNPKLLSDYKSDIQKCSKAGEKQNDCVNQVNKKFIRKIPGIEKTIYPWTNYDWDYATYIDNNYNKDKTGASDAGTFSALLDNPIALAKLSMGFMTNPNPSSSSSSANTDLPECDPSSVNYNGCKIINDIKRSQIQRSAPYPDSFFNKYPLTGENSSSYYIKVGNCPTSLTQQQCKSKGYNWIENPIIKAMPSELVPPDSVPGNCFKPRYAYIQNHPGMKLPLNAMKNMKDAGVNFINNQMGKLNPKLKNIGKGAEAVSSLVETGEIIIANKLISEFNGEIPSIIGDGLSINPLNMEKILTGKETDDFKLQTCETFIGNKKTQKNYLYIFLFLLIILLIYYLSKVRN